MLASRVRSMLLAMALLFPVAVITANNSDAAGNNKLLDELHLLNSSQNRLAGYFSQCVIHGSVTMSGFGRYELFPDSRFTMEFEQPNRYSLTFFKDGTYIRNDSSTGKSPEKYNAIGRLMFSMLSMDRLAIENRFLIQTTGTIEDFEVTLTPAGRMKKLFRIVRITGTDGRIDSLNIVTSDEREIAISLSSENAALKAGCG